MPSVGIAITPLGPFIAAYVGVSGAKLTALKAQGQPAPPLVSCRLLLDTGASNTNICKSVLQQLPIVATGSTLVHTPTTGDTPVARDQFDVNLYIAMQHPGTATGAQQQTPFHTITNLPVMASDFVSQGFQGLLGRDVLQMGTFSYLGHLGFCSLSF